MPKDAKMPNVKDEFRTRGRAARDREELSRKRPRSNGIE